MSLPPAIGIRAGEARFQLSLCLGVAALVGASSLSAQSYYWGAFAGLPPQLGSADGVGTSARFYRPRGLVAAASNVVYVCDSSNYTIRRIAVDGTVTTMAGTAGQRGSTDGTGAAARFGYPTGITLTGGALFIADAGNNTIRRLRGDGSVSTFAGLAGVTGTADGSTLSARFNAPGAITSDASGSLYVADTENHTIRRITPEGEVSTIAGAPGSAGSSDGPAGSARFNRPGGIWVTSAGFIYVADTSNHTIRRIAPDGTVSTVAGSPGNSGSQVGVGSAARFSYPSGIVAYGDGTLLVSDLNHAISLISSAGNVTTYAGRSDVEGSRNGARTDARFNYPSALAPIDDGIVITDSLNHSIRKINFSEGIVGTLAGSPGNFGRRDGIGSEALMNYPSGVAVHSSSGDVYVADSRGNSIRRITPAGQVIRVAGAESGDAYIDGPAEVQSLNYPYGVAVAPDRTVYFSEQQRHTIRILRPDGSVATLAGREGVLGTADGAGDAARFYLPSGIALDREGNLYIADMGNSTIRRIAAGTNIVRTFAGAPLVLGSADGTSARFRVPRGVATDRDGNVYVADTNNHTIRKITPAGEVSTLAGQAQVVGAANGTGSTARFAFPFSLTVDGEGTIFVADAVNFTIRRIAGNTVSTIGGLPEVPGYRDGAGTAALFSQPNGIAVDRAGNLYVSESSNSIVRRGEFYTRPTISAEPRSMAVAVGANVSLTVAASGGGLRYQWQRNGVSIPGATSATYTLSNATAAASGQYSATVTNGLGSISTATATLAIAPATDAGRLINLSILSALTTPGDNFTLGFVVGGSGTTGAKPLVIRAAGPSLGALGVGDTLPDPQFELFFGSRKLGENDNWGGLPDLAAAMRNVGAFAYAATDSRDSAAAGFFDSGNNSVKVSGVADSTGTVIAEIYDATPSGDFTTATPRLVNVSVLKHIGSRLVAGFAIGGAQPKKVLIRAIGPTLGAEPFGVGGVVTDPQLTLFAGQTSIGSNDNWRGTPELTAAFGQVGAFGLPSDSRDAALLATLNPGTYTVEVSGVGGTTGIALVEIYEVP